MKPCSFCGGYGEVLDGNIISKCPECAGYRAIYGEDDTQKKAIGFKLQEYPTGEVYGEVWSEDGKKLGCWTSSNEEYLKLDLAAHTKGYLYEFVDHIPKFVKPS